MASTNTTQRTFTKFFQLRELPVATIAFPCQDSAGVVQKCNYFNISIAPLAQAAITNPSPVIFISPSSGNITVASSLDYTNNALVTGASSLAAGAASPFGISLLVTSGISQYEYLCLPNEFFNSVRLVPFSLNPGGVAGNNAYTVCITYGVVDPFNNLRATDKYLYTKGS